MLGISLISGRRGWMKDGLSNESSVNMVDVEA